MRRLAFLVFFFAAAACDETPPPKTGLSYTQNAEHAYDQAMEEFKAHNWAESQPLFAELKKKYSYTKWARLAELRYADADFEQEKFAEALREYKQFIHDHKTDVGVEYARERIAETNYRQISDSFLLPSADERDQTSIRDAYADLLSFLKDYPKSKEAPHACELLDDVVARLVRHELYVARFYLARDNFEAAVNRVQFAMRNYSGNDLCVAKTSLIPDALLLLGETYMRMHRWGDARTAFETLMKSYPQSELIPQAQRYIETLAKKT
ncbi:MAG TPA: outer membrane protein assembly factor BamD [Polyangiaceae bacterium]